MRIAESVYVQGRPVGRLIVDTNSHEIVFQPRESPSRLPDQSWNSVDQLKQAVFAAYSYKKSSPGLTSELPYPLTEDLPPKTITRGSD